MLSALLFVGSGALAHAEPGSASPAHFQQVADPITRVIAPPGVEVESGGTIPVGIYYRNAGPAAHTFVPSERVRVQLVTPRSTLELELVRVEANAGVVELAAGATRYEAYALTLPVELDGRVLVQFPGRESAPALLGVRRKAASDGGATPPNDAGPANSARNLPGARATITDQGRGASPSNPDPSAAAPARDRSASADRSPDAVPLAADKDGLPLAPPIPIAEHVIQRFSAHEPNYFLGGDRPSTRFQFSFKYQVFDPESEFASEHPWIGSMRVGYTQTSLWDVAGKSKPFTDSSYKPEIFWSRDRLDSVRLPGVTQFGLETGLQHESNGRDGDDSRSLNVFYVRPVLVLGDPERFHWRVMPKFMLYVFDQEDNPDIERYRGWCDLRVAAGRVEGLEVAAQLRVGSGFDRASLQLDATYPLGSVSDAYLQLQYFRGYGESLLRYDEHDESLRFGIALSR